MKKKYRIIQNTDGRSPFPWIVAYRFSGFYIEAVGTYRGLPKVWTKPIYILKRTNK